MIKRIFFKLNDFRWVTAHYAKLVENILAMVHGITSVNALGAAN